MIQHKAPIECLVIGAGILGLWAARHAIMRGESVVVLEKRTVGAGGSGGFLGALMPHMPDSWNVKKQMQYEGLSSIQDAIALLEGDTSLDCGFRRCGRLMPLTHEKMVGHLGQRAGGAKQNWGKQYSLEHLDSWKDPSWINPGLTPYGIQHDTLSARVDPRKYVAALESYAREHAEICEGEEVVELRPGEGGVRLASGEIIAAKKIIVANGWEAYPLLQPFMGEINDGNPVGRGVKGQAVLVEFEHKEDLPIVYHDGAYVVPHSNNRVAIGSTSISDWQSGPGNKPDQFDRNDMGFYKRAIELVPALANAPIIDRWAGVRPRNTIAGRGTDPWFGPVPGHDNLFALIGGFKITFGVAHRAGELTDWT